MGEHRLRWESVVQPSAVLFAGLLLCATLVAFVCWIGVGKTVTPVVAESKIVSIGDSQELMDALRGAGGLVRPAGAFTEPFFGVGGQVVNVDGTLVLVFEYPSQRERERESQLISVDGTSVGGRDIRWTDQPNFWASGRVIVQYLGSDQEMLSLLHNALGKSITVHEQISASSQ